MKWKKRGFFRKEKKRKTRGTKEGEGVQGNRSSRRRCSPAVAGAEAAIAGSKPWREKAGQDRGGDHAGGWVLGDERDKRR
jgi:hypothetical protein